MSPRGIDPGLHLDLGSDFAGGGIHLLGGAPNPSTHVRYGLYVNSLALHVNRTETAAEKTAACGRALSLAGTSKHGLTERLVGGVRLWAITESGQKCQVDGNACRNRRAQPRRSL